MNKVRIYSFRDLMQRLMHRDWAVTYYEGEFIFIPRSYLPGRKM